MYACVRGIRTYKVDLSRNCCGPPESEMPWSVLYYYSAQRLAVSSQGLRQCRRPFFESCHLKTFYVMVPKSESRELNIEFALHGEEITEIHHAQEWLL